MNLRYKIWKLKRSKTYQNTKVKLYDILYDLHLISDEKLTNTYAEGCAMEFMRSLKPRFLAENNL